MSFSSDPQLQDFYDHAIKPAITDAGYQCYRVDEQEFNGSIRNQIISAIRDCNFVVADVTEARPNCYYELGVAHALGKEVIHLARSAEDIHFDVRDFNFIIYSRLDDLKRKLRKRIESTIGPSGP
jgi:nucleoside 2-deoxyribosyltransferase